jgi:outer membrane protein assembly factor BamB
VHTSSTIYADEGGEITALASASGRQRWQRSLGSNVYAEWLTDGILVIDVDQVGSHARIVGLDPKTGAVIWTYHPAGEGFYGNPVMAGHASLVVIMGGPDRVGVIDTANGRLRWTDRIKVENQPVAGAGVVAIDPAGALRGLDLATGAQRWVVRHTDRAAALTLDGGVIAVGSQIDPDTTPLSGYGIRKGAHRWTLPFDASYGQIAVTPAGLVIGQRDPVDKGGLVLVNPSTGAIRWKVTTTEPSWQSLPVITGPDLVTLQGRPDNGRFRLQDRSVATGRLLAAYVVPKDQYFAALADDSHAAVLVTGFVKTGFIERIKAGRVQWRTTLPQTTAQAALPLAGGGAFIQSEDFPCAIAT